jgi:hypothetical protein
MSVRFEPKWPEDPNEDGFYMPEDEDARTLPPNTARTEVFDIISSTYLPGKSPINTLAKFTLFPKLPFELRRIIWRYSLPRRRVVDVLSDDKTGECKSPCPIPTALHVNSEARGVALESYELVFSTQKANAMVYFDFSVDALYIGVGNFSPSRSDPTSVLFRAMQYNDLKRIEHLIIDDQIFFLYPSIEEVDSDSIDDEGQDNSDADSNEPQRGFNKYVALERLRAVTIINNYGNNDLVLQESEDNKGEFHAWCVLDDGKLLHYSPHLMLESVELAALSHFSNLWRLAELVKWEGKEPSLTTLRFVSRERLREEEVWIKRMGFLDQVVLPRGYNCCLYRKDGVIDRIMEMEEDQDVTDLFDYLYDYFDADPEFIYISQNPCVCPIGHKHQEPGPYPTGIYDLRMALAFIDLTFDEILEAPPGAFPEEHSLGDLETSLTLQSSSEAVFVASPQAQEIDLESTPPFDQEFYSLEIGTDALPKHVPQPIAIRVPFLIRWFVEEWGASHDLPVFSLGTMVCIMLILNPSQVLRGFFVFIASFFIARLRLHQYLTPDFALLLCCMVWYAAFSVFASLNRQVSQLMASAAGQRPLKRFYPSNHNLEAVHRKAYQVYCMCVILGTWLLLFLVGLALAFSLMRFIVDLLSILMLLIAALWLLAIWLIVQELRDK